MKDQRPNLYLIKGGIGKCAAFTPLIKRLAQRDGKKIVVGSGFPGVFSKHPAMAGTINSITPEAITPHAQKFDDIVMREPYISNYCKGDRHILDEWAKLYGLDPFENGGFNARPDMYLPDVVVKQGVELKEQLKRPFMIVQWTGGQPPNNLKKGGKYPDNYLTKARNVQNYVEIMRALAETYPEHVFVLYALPNEPVELPADLKRRVARAKAASLAYAALLRDADSFVALDSSLQHFAAAEQINKKGVVLWGKKTTPQQIGYAFHTNLNSTVDDGVQVTPAAVIDALSVIVPKKK
jgi:hypothetical protein